MKQEDITQIRDHLKWVLELADEAFSRAAVDRHSDAADLDSALLGLLGWIICQGYCVTEGLNSKTPQGVASNVRSMLEALITALYLIDPAASEAERHDRLDRFYRGVRRAQVKLRRALDDYSSLKKVFEVDSELAKHERDEYEKNERTLSPDRRLKGGHWSGKPEALKGMAEAVGIGSDYAVQYRLHSGSLHGNRPWDQVLFDPSGALILPSLSDNAAMALPLAFDALRYLSWILSITDKSGSVRLYASEQAQLDSYDKYMQPMDALFDKGIVGAG